MTCSPNLHENFGHLKCKRSQDKNRNTQSKDIQMEERDTKILRHMETTTTIDQFHSNRYTTRRTTILF